MKIMPMRNIGKSFILLFLIIAYGVIGYRIIEGMDFFDAFYMTVITISTVGFQEVKPLSGPGKILTITIISGGITVAAYTIGTLVRSLVEGEIKKMFGRRKVEKKISEMSGHYIICGYGRIGRLVCGELREYGMEFVVIENGQQAIEMMETDRVPYLPQDATADETLMKAGIMKARGIVTAVGSDADNVFITLTARGLRSDIFILARASDEKNEMKLNRAGATRVVSPYLIGGKRMAQVLIRPTVVDFIDVAVSDGHLGLQMEECRVKQDSNLAGKNLVESGLRKDYGVIIVLIKKHNGEMIFNPLPGEVIEGDDILVVLGKKEDMKRMGDMI